MDGVAEAGRRLAPEDLLATAVEVVAGCVARSLREHGPGSVRRLAVAGGGVHHGPLMGALGRLTGLEVVSSAALGVDPDAREALVFAVLGARCALGVPSTRTGATGAAPGRVLGKLSHQPPR